MKAVQVLSVGIAPVSRDEFRAAVVGMLRAKQPSAVAKVNAEFLLHSLDDEAFARYLGSTALNIADGAGVLWAARFLTMKSSRLPVVRHLQVVGQAAISLASLLVFPRYCRHPIPERIPGVDAMLTMLEAAREADAAVYFLGATEDINLKARTQLQSQLPGLKIAGGHHGYTDDWAPVLSDIEKSGARLLIVALGCPKQEFWIRDHLSGLGEVRVAVGEGGSLDFITGDFRRAPRWLQTAGLEWFWRMFMNRNKSGSISRARRIWNAVPVFIGRTIGWKLKNGWVRVEEPGRR